LVEHELSTLLFGHLNQTHFFLLVIFAFLSDNVLIHVEFSRTILLLIFIYTKHLFY